MEIKKNQSEICGTFTSKKTRICHFVDFESLTQLRVGDVERIYEVIRNNPNIEGPQY
jgi:hypothetical protein